MTICYERLIKEKQFSSKVENTFLIFFSILQSISKAIATTKAACIFI